MEEIIEKSGLFDKVYYLKTYRDVRIANMTPLEHFMKFGLQEDRKPNAEFDPVWYRNYYCDINKNNLFPIVHFIQYGKEENLFQNETEKNEYNQLIENDFDVMFYKNSYQDLAYIEDENFDFVLHYLRYGKYEDRKIRFNTSINSLNKEDLEILQKSELFDEEYYLNTYNDIKTANIIPAEHYMEHGHLEGRNPSVLFNTNFYLEKYPDVRELKVNPLLHYIKYGQDENREILPTVPKYLDASSIISFFEKNLYIPSFRVEKEIDIIIPVYNGRQYLEPLFQSLLQNTSMPYRLLVCDDKSSDESVFPLLNKFKEENPKVNMVLLQNEQNLGFIETVNKLSLLAENHFVLLNTDTEVPSFWIERLMYPIFTMENIASTTPFTNAGTICSFPNYLQDNLIFKSMNVEELDNYFKKVHFENTYIEIPTGIGFCMGVNKTLVDQIGMFDEVFGKGYGEENDWCQRAILEGYKNLHVTNLFVYHKHGGSFDSQEKKKLVENNLKILNSRYPSYEGQIQTLIRDNSLENLRKVIELKVLCETNMSYLIVDHDLGGGANDYSIEKVSNHLASGDFVCIIKFLYQNTKQYLIELKHADTTVKLRSKSIQELYEFIAGFEFKNIFINSLVSFPDIRQHIKAIAQLKNNNPDARLIVPIHDFFPICPSYTLLNEAARYCGVPKDFLTCSKCLKLNNGEFKMFEKTTNIYSWRTNWGMMLELADEVLCFSSSSKDIVLRAYPFCEEKIEVIPHNISGRYTKIYKERENKEELRIGILGRINEAKGAKIIHNLVEHIDQNHIDAKVVLIGEISIPMVSPSFEVTGGYQKNELEAIVLEKEIDVFLIPSVWPETFSYTTEEIMEMGYPLIVFDFGAPAERVRKYPLGRVVNPDELYDALFPYREEA